MSRFDVKSLVKYQKVVKIAVSLIFLYVLLVKFVSLDTLLRTVADIQYWMLGSCLLIAIVTLLLRSARWRYSISPAYHVRYADLLRLYTIGLYYGSITPGKAGEFVRGYHLESLTGMKKIEGIVSVFFERTYDIVLPIIFVLTAILVRTPPLETFFLSFILCVPAIVLGYAIYNRFVVKKFQFLSEAAFPMRNVVISTVLTVAIWIGYIVVAYIILGSLGQNVPFGTVAFSVFVANIISLIPVTIGGWGLREGAYVYLLSAVDPAVSVVFSVLFVLLTTYFLGLFGMVLELLSPSGRRKGDESISAQPAEPGH